MFPNDNDQDTGDNAVELYSRNAIRGFSVFFSPIFGGVLLMLNLWRAGFKRAIIGVAVFCIVYTGICAVVASQVVTPANILSILLNALGGVVLTEYFFNKYFPDDDYYPRSIARPLGFSLMITLIFVTIILLKYGYPPPGGLK